MAFPSTSLQPRKCLKPFGKGDATVAETYLISSSNLTVPPLIPSFHVRITHDHNPVVNALGMFSAAIQLMSVLALKNWDGHTNGYIVHGPRYYPATLELQAWPDPSSGLLLVKHAVVGLYEAGNSLARSPAVADPFLTRLFGGLFLRNQQIGYIKCLPRSASLQDEVNSTLSIVNAVNSTVALELRPNDGPQAELTDDSGSFVDPIYGSFTYTYQLKDRTVDLRDIFSVFLDAMATAAPQHIDQPGAVINVASESGNLALNLHGYPSLSGLPWLCVSRFLGLVWIPVIVKAHKYVEMDFQVYFEGRVIGRGFMMSTHPPQASVASS